MYGFLRSRRWIVASIVVLAAVVTMVALGLWQLRRLDEVRSDNARVRARLTLPAEPVASVLAPGVAPAAATYRRVEAVGRYDASGEVLVSNRSFQGRPGSHVLTPLVTADGRSLVVDRGWVPLDPGAPAAAPPAGEVRVAGALFPSERRGTFGASIPAEGRLTRMPRIDVARIAKQLAVPVYPMYLRLQTQTPAQAGELPVPPGLPALDDGPHLSYAVQWFIFAAIAALTYLALVRRAVRRPTEGGPTTGS